MKSKKSNLPVKAGKNLINKIKEISKLISNAQDKMA